MPRALEPVQGRSWGQTVTISGGGYGDYEWEMIRSFNGPSVTLTTNSGGSQPGHSHTYGARPTCLQQTHDFNVAYNNRFSKWSFL